MFRKSYQLPRICFLLTDTSTRNSHANARIPNFYTKQTNTCPQTNAEKMRNFFPPRFCETKFSHLIELKLEILRNEFYIVKRKRTHISISAHATVKTKRVEPWSETISVLRNENKTPALVVVCTYINNAKRFTWTLNDLRPCPWHLSFVKQNHRPHRKLTSICI